MKKLRMITLVILLLSFMTSNAYAKDGKEVIEVNRNYASITVDGVKIKTKTLQNNNTQYAPLKDIVEALGGKYEWDPLTKIISIQTAISENVNYSKVVDVYSPKLSLAVLKLKSPLIDAYRLECNGNQVESQLNIEGDSILLTLNTWLDYNTRYVLKLFMNDGSRKIVHFKTSGLPKLTLSGERQIIFVPAMPDQGFNYPYYLVLPKKLNVLKNKGKKNYLFVETHNTGKVGNELDFHISEAYSIAEGGSASIADKLGLPRIVPILVRPEIPIFDNQYVYTHALSRQTIYLEDLKKVAGTYDEVFEPMNRVDEQVVKMIQHANKYLTDNGWKMEKKIFIWGFSASGDFTSRFSFLHPEIVKAACFGGHPIFPIAKEKDFDLIYPFGTSDYKKITGKEFDLKAYNNVAKLGYAGSKDYQGDPLAFSDLYVSEAERDIVKNLLGSNKYPQGWNIMGDIFKRSGGQGQVNIYLGAAHETFYKGMTQDYLNFFTANRESTKPVYVMPSDPANTLTTIYSKDIVEVENKPFSYDKTTITEAFWSGTVPQLLPKSFVDWFVQQESSQYSENVLLISIDEWDMGNSSQMSDRIAKVGGKLTLTASGYKDVQIVMNGGSCTAGTGDAQIYFATVDNIQDLVSGVKYKISDKTGHWIVLDDVSVERPKK